jgi:alkanesulfonate monooxygenase SsuD/methylene tetrahydromethanopterin reductase-like flavin-dependent oxidoreductase (luciferase family)
MACDAWRLASVVHVLRSRCGPRFVHLSPGDLCRKLARAGTVPRTSSSSGPGRRRRPLVKFGTFTLPTYFPEIDGSLAQFYDNMLAMIRDSERLGFDFAWCNEHHFNPYGGMIPSPAVLLTAVAMQTSRIRLGTSVILLPLHHPIEQAESMAMLDQLSHGRLEVGFGRGFVGGDYKGYGVPYETAQDQLYEGIEVVQAAWQQQPFSHKGRFYNIEEVPVWPTPYQQPYPPLWGAATRSEESFAYWGMRGFNLLTVIYLFSVDKVAEQVRIFRDAAATAGHDVSKLRVSTHYQVCCSEDGDEARRVGKAAVLRYAEQIVQARSRATTVVPFVEPSFEDMLRDGRVCMGTPDECVAVLKNARDTIGLSNLDCQFYFGGIPFEQARRSQELFATEVMPRLREPEPAKVSAKA